MAVDRSLRKYSVNSVDSLFGVVLKFEASSSVPRLYFVIRKSGRAVEAFATHIDNISGCGEPDLLLKVRRFSAKRPSRLDVRKKSSARAGVELAQGAISPRR